MDENNDPTIAQLCVALNGAPNPMGTNTDQLRREILGGRLAGYQDHRGHWRVERREYERLLREKGEAAERAQLARLEVEAMPVPLHKLREG